MLDRTLVCSLPFQELLCSSQPYCLGSNHAHMQIIFRLSIPITPQRYPYVQAWSSSRGWTPASWRTSAACSAPPRSL